MAKKVEMMKRLILVVILFVALGSTDTQAQYRQQVPVWGSVEDDRTIYSDDRGEYRWEMRERRVWVPERRAGGIFGVGGRTIPGHYETRMVREKVYLGREGNRKQHPHGMPPGQRKKMGRYDDRRYDNRGRRIEDIILGDRRDRRYGDRRDDDRRYDDRRYEDRDDDDRYYSDERRRDDDRKKAKGKSKK